jgi:hypothetical protein
MDTTTLHLVPGVLENAQTIVAELRAEYEAQRHRRPDGLLKHMYAAFGLDPNPQRVSRRGPMFSSSSAKIGALVHRELELAASGATVANPHEFTTMIAAHFHEQGWAVIASEVPLVVPEANLYTRIDLLVFDMHLNRVLLVEIKTGSDQGRRARLVSRTAHLGLPGKDVPDSHYARAHLQLAWMYAALTRLKGLRVEPLVLLANTLHGVRVEKSPKWAQRNAALVFDRVCAHRVAHRIAPGSITSGAVNN